MGTWPELIARARRAAGLSQSELAGRAATSRPTLSAYEHGRKAPTADTLERLLAAAGFALEVCPVVEWREVSAGRGRSWWVPDRLWRLNVGEAFAEVVLPVELNWSTPGHRFRARNRRERARLYEVLLREGTPTDLQWWLDGALLIDAWDDLVLPHRLRQAWQELVDRETASAGGSTGAGRSAPKGKAS